MSNLDDPFGYRQEEESARESRLIARLEFEEDLRVEAQDEASRPVQTLETVTGNTVPISIQLEGVGRKSS
jgi:hypothetical protein